MKILKSETLILKLSPSLETLEKIMSGIAEKGNELIIIIFQIRVDCAFISL